MNYEGSLLCFASGFFIVRGNRSSGLFEHEQLGELTLVPLEQKHRFPASQSLLEHVHVSPELFLALQSASAGFAMATREEKETNNRAFA